MVRLGEEMKGRELASTVTYRTGVQVIFLGTRERSSSLWLGLRV